MQLVVDQHQGQRGQQRAAEAKAELPGERPQRRRQTQRGHPQKRAHRRQRRRSEQVAGAGVVAVDDDLAGGGRVGDTPLAGAGRDVAGAGDLQPVRPVAPGAVHAEIDQRREAQPHQREHDQRQQPRAQQPAVAPQLCRQRTALSAEARAAQRRRPQGDRDTAGEHDEAGGGEHVGGLQHQRAQRDGGIAEAEAERQPGGNRRLARPVQRQARTDAGHQHQQCRGEECTRFQRAVSVSAAVSRAGR